MKRLRHGIVGAGFVGPHHIEAARRLEGRDELFPTFETGYRVGAIVDAVIRSQEQGSRGVEVDYR